MNRIESRAVAFRKADVSAHLREQILNPPCVCADGGEAMNDTERGDLPEGRCRRCYGVREPKGRVKV